MPQMMNIQIKLENNEILSDEIQRLIKEAVKSVINADVKSDIDCEVNKKMSAYWTHLTSIENNYNGESRLDKCVRKYFDKKIDKYLENVKLDDAKIRQHINVELEKIPERVDNITKTVLDRMNFTEILVKGLGNKWPEHVAQLLETRRITELQEQIQALKTENAVLRSKLSSDMITETD